MGVRLPDLRQTPTFIINLRRRPDRMDLMQALVTKLELAKVDVVEAVDGQKLKESAGEIQHMSNIDHILRCTPTSSEGIPCWFMERVQQRVNSDRSDDGLKNETMMDKSGDGGICHRVRLSSSRDPSEKWGLLGSLLSHAEALRRMMSSQDESDVALILEDDADLGYANPDNKNEGFIEPSDFHRRFAEAEQHLPDDWQVLYLGGVIGFKSKAAEEQLRHASLSKGWLLRGSNTYQVHAYLVRRCVAPLILERIGRGFAVDAALISALTRTFRFSPELLRQRTGTGRKRDSNITNDENSRPKPAALVPSMREEEVWWRCAEPGCGFVVSRQDSRRSQKKYTHQAKVHKRKATCESVKLSGSTHISQEVTGLVASVNKSCDDDVYSKRKGCSEPSCHSHFSASDAGVAKQSMEDSDACALQGGESQKRARWTLCLSNHSAQGTPSSSSSSSSSLATNRQGRVSDSSECGIRIDNRISDASALVATSLRCLKLRVESAKQKIAAGCFQPYILRELADTQEKLVETWCSSLQSDVERTSQQVSQGDRSSTTLRELADAKEELLIWQARATSDFRLAVALILSSLQ